MSISSRSQNSSAWSSGVSPAFPRSNFFCDSLYICSNFTSRVASSCFFAGLSSLLAIFMDCHWWTRRQLYSMLCCLLTEWEMCSEPSPAHGKLWSAGCWSGLLVCHSHGDRWTEELAPRVCSVCLLIVCVPWRRESEPCCGGTGVSLNRGNWKSRVWKPWKAEIAHMWKHPLSKYLWSCLMQNFKMDVRYVD